MSAHPLDPLSEDEFRSTAAILRRDQGRVAGLAIRLDRAGRAGQGRRCKAWARATRSPRRSLSVLWEKATNKTYEAVVDLIGDPVVSWTHVPGVSPNFTVDEWHDCDHALQENPEVVAALAERGLTDLSLVLIDVWTYGTR